MKKNSRIIVKLTILLCLITTGLVSSHTLSKYASGATLETNVSVAAYSSKVTGTGETSYTMDCNSSNPSISYTIDITNEENSVVSMVDMTYDVIVDFHPYLPEGMTMTISENGTEIATATGGEATYTINLGEFTANVKESKSFVLTLTGDENVKNSYDGNMSIKVKTSQID